VVVDLAVSDDSVSVGVVKDAEGLLSLGGEVIDG